MKNRLIIFLLLIIPFTSFSQDIKSILSEIEKNNSTLKAYQGLTDARKLETHTGIFPDNPEIGYSYQWGNPSAIGKKRNISITQSWDFPTVYGLKKQIASSQNEQIDLDYQLRRLEVLAKAKSICNELVYLNSLNQELLERLSHAKKITNAYNSRFEKGDANILEKNKAALNLLIAKNKLQKNETEKTALLSELSALNGGNPVVFSDTEYLITDLPDNFEGWFTQMENQIPVLQQSQNEIEINQKEIQLNKAKNLPRFSTGYASELLDAEAFRGISFEVSIPLWENKNTVKLAKAKKTATEKVAVDARILYYNHLKVQFEKTQNLQNILDDFKDTLPSINNAGLLKKALDAGEISLINYMLELSLYYETINTILETELEFNQAVAALYYFNQ
ncbi:MAG: TolC family protein [Mariniphaga sp.]|nr:TolC family protein [Mariniphaga sp.]